MIIGNGSKTDGIYAKTFYKFHKVISPEHIMVPFINPCAEKF